MSFDPAVRYIDTEIHSDYDSIAEATHLDAEREEKREESYEPQIVHPLAALPVTIDSEIARELNGEKIHHEPNEENDYQTLRALCRMPEGCLRNLYRL